MEGPAGITVHVHADASFQPTRLMRAKLSSDLHGVKSNMCFLVLAFFDRKKVSDIGDIPLQSLLFQWLCDKIDLICLRILLWVLFLCVSFKNKNWCCQGFDAYLSPILLGNLISSLLTPTYI